MRSVLVVLLLALVAGCAGASPAAVASGPAATGAASRAPASAPPSSGALDPLLALELVDVRSGETFTLGELAADRPVLLETMAIWCTTCLRQQREVVAAHGAGEFHSVGIDVDPNERAEELAAYAEREGFDWRFAIADAELVRLLTDRFGIAVTNPPSTPTFVVSGGAIRALEFNRVRTADELLDELAAG
jgi:thiol-disulfide isomerase/thioredoxin